MQWSSSTQTLRAPLSDLDEEAVDLSAVREIAVVATSQSGRAWVLEASGWRQGLASIPRVIVANAIAMLAARKAVFRYLAIRRTGAMQWGKTAHAFPAELPAE